MRHNITIEIPELRDWSDNPIEKEQLHALYVSGQEKLSIETIAYVLDADPVIVFLHMERHGIHHRVMDSYVAAKGYEWTEAQTSHLLREEAKSKIKMSEPTAERIEVNGKTYVDRSMVDGYERKITEEIWARRSPPKELNVIRNVDLSAMRLHRGLDMFQFSQKADIPYKQVLYYEKTPEVVVPKEVSEIYFKILNISRGELKKIKEVLSGKRESMFEEDDRTIPSSVRNYVWKRDSGKCRECGTDKYLHIHHVKHFADGGKHQARNLKLLCVGCHAMEHYGEPGFAMLKARAEKLGVSITGGERHAMANRVP